MSISNEGVLFDKKKNKYMNSTNQQLCLDHPQTQPHELHLAMNQILIETLQSQIPR